MDVTPVCEITDEGVTVRVLGFPKRIPFSEIKKVEKVSYARAALESMNLSMPAMWGLWNMSLFGVVLIETKDRRRWAVSPKDRDEFVDLISRHLPAANQDLCGSP